VNASAPELGRPRPVGKIGFDRKSLDAIAEEILREGGPRVIRLRDAKGRSVVFVARHADVREVLTDEARFRVSHYTRLYGSIAPPGERLLMHEEDDQRRLRYEILQAAVAETPWFDPDGAALPKLAETTVADLLATFSARRSPSFDAIGEYAYLAPYLVGTRVLGLAGPTRAGLFERLVCFLKSFPDGRRFTPETTPYLTQFVWSQLVFGHLFGNFDNGVFLLRLVARLSAHRLLDHIGRQLPMVAEDDDPAHRSLFSALLSKPVRERFEARCEGRYEDHVAALMLELMGTMQAVPGMAFTTILQDWQERDVSFEEALAPLAAVDARLFVMETLRMSPPARFLLRNATPGAKVAGVELGDNEYVCALLANATMNPDEVMTPNEILPRDRQVYLHFGPLDGPHRCFGRHVAPIILGAMFQGLKSLSHLRAGQIKGNGFPDRMTAAFSPQPRPQPREPDETERLMGVAA
jgi:cytochrome P450